MHTTHWVPTAMRPAQPARFTALVALVYLATLLLVLFGGAMSAGAVMNGAVGTNAGLGAISWVLLPAMLTVAFAFAIL